MSHRNSQVVSLCRCSPYSYHTSPEVKTYFFCVDTKKITSVCPFANSTHTLWICNICLEHASKRGNNKSCWPVQILTDGYVRGYPACFYPQRTHLTVQTWKKLIYDELLLWHLELPSFKWRCTAEQQANSKRPIICCYSLFYLYRG